MKALEGTDEIGIVLESAVVGNFLNGFVLVVKKRNGTIHSEVEKIGSKSRAAVFMK